MRILWVATKPADPPTDGGRLLLSLTIEALTRRGHEVELVAPAQAPRTWPAALVRSVARGEPLAIARHVRPVIRDMVAARLGASRFDVVVAEQIHALPQCAPARERGLPVVLRAQNVESDLWAGLAAAKGAPRGVLEREARKLAAWEGAAVCSARLTLALSDADAARLRVLAGPDARVETVNAPFPESLPVSGSPLDGEPAIVLFGSAWAPNREGVRWFLREAWPLVVTRLPSARLHLFGFEGQGRAVVRHPPPTDSAAAFAPRACLVIPLLRASGVRLRILEAWARGVSVVSTPEGAAGLDVRGVALARSAEEFATALAELEAPRAGALAAAGRAALRRDHDPAAVASRLETLLALAAGHQS